MWEHRTKQEAIRIAGTKKLDQFFFRYCITGEQIKKQNTWWNKEKSEKPGVGHPPNAKFREKSIDKTLDLGQRARLAMRSPRKWCEILSRLVFFTKNTNKKDSAEDPTLGAHKHTHTPTWKILIKMGEWTQPGNYALFP